MRIIRYHDLTDDVIAPGQAEPALPDNFRFARTTWPERLVTASIYRGARLFGRWYWHRKLRVRYVNLAALAPYRGQSLFLYGNHTQEIGDPFLPMQLLTQPVYTLASAANRKVPVLGPLLPYGRALVLPQTKAQTRRFLAALQAALGQGGAVAIYPEAHVWPYYTGIRPFRPGSFHYPVATNRPSFAFTTTYQDLGTTVYVDGPFWPDPALNKAARQAALAAQVQAAMLDRADASTTQHILYRREES
ncbi:lysophospholipid acyltransferase family protein [Lacticaseibacillus parakribbianus]|uniref:lysophospholipid acyltransferase family protein n=1 Tax=Lacticaseibacillus parakribbianus TaxID=2970927 RepID=UPI0021CAFD8A|nr:1-acyl-sn-glycerol-3-phosphate acyltransferase [Lacticaseibacillus parakribbianus]